MKHVGNIWADIARAVRLMIAASLLMMAAICAAALMM